MSVGKKVKVRYIQPTVCLADTDNKKMGVNNDRRDDTGGRLPTRPKARSK